MFTSNPTVSPAYQNGRLLLICEYEVENSDSNMNIEVTWYKGNTSQEVRKEIITVQQRRKAYLQSKEKSKPLFRLGTTVCDYL